MSHCCRGRCSTLQRLADREDRVASQRLVDQHTRDAHHGGAAVVALGVELPRAAEEELLLAHLLRRAVTQIQFVAVGVARPQPTLRDHIARLLGRILLEEVHLAEGDEEDEESEDEYEEDEDDEEFEIVIDLDEEEEYDIGDWDYDEDGSVWERIA